MFDRALIQDKFLIIFGLITIVFSVSVSANYYRLFRSQQVWNDYLEQVDHRNKYLNRIQEHLGYGGAIHHFKNFVMRGDSIYLERFLSDYDEVVQGIEEYRSLHEITQIEVDALSNIEQVAQQYRENIDRINSLSQSSQNISVIDQSVRVDDQPAISGFQTLRVFFADRTASYNNELTTAINSARTAMIAGFVISAAVLLIAFVTLGRSISRPIEKLMVAVKRFARGDFDTRINFNRQDEIGELGNGFDAMAANVTQLFESLDVERKRAEKNEKFLQDVSQIASIGGWELDLQEQRFALTIEGSKIFGFDQNKGIDYEQLSSYYLPSSHDLLDQTMQESIKTGSAWELELELENTDGHILWVKKIGEVDHKNNRLIGMLQDITDRKKAEIALNDSHHNLEEVYSQLASMINATTDAIVAIDKNYNYLQFNSAYKPYSFEIMGAEIEEGMSLHDHLSEKPETLEEFQQYWSFALAGNSFTQVQQVGNIHHDGRAFQHVFNPISNNHGTIIGAVNVIHDITDRIRQDLLKEQFISSVNHELRTPLTALKGSLMILGSNSLGKLPEEYKPMLAMANRNTQRLERLVGDLLDLQKIEENRIDIQKKIVRLPTLLQQSMDAGATHASQYDVRLQLDAPVPDVELKIDPSRFQQLMDNLISNACKFSHKGGTVNLSIEQRASDVRILIKDEGVGIPESFIPFLFDRFRQSDGTLNRSRLGTGLGLYISKKLVSRFEGSLDVRSKEGKGSTFIVTLPIWVAEVEEQVEAISH